MRPRTPQAVTTPVMRSRSSPQPPSSDGHGPNRWHAQARGVGDDSAKNRRNPWSMKRVAPVEVWTLGSPGTHCKRGIGKCESGSHTDAEWASAARGLQSHDGSEGSGAKGLGREFERRASPAVLCHSWATAQCDWTPVLTLWTS